MARTFDDAAIEVGSRLRLDTAQAKTLALVRGWLNDTIQDIHSRYDWFWTLDRTTIPTVVDKTAGTVSVAASATAVVGSGTAFSSVDVGKMIQFSGSNDWYKVSAVTDASNLTLEKSYNGTAALTAGTYIIRKTLYSLASAEKILTATQAQNSKKLVCRHFRDFDSDIPFGDSTGNATQLCLFGLDTSGNLQFSIYPHADVAYNLELRFKKAATESDLSLVPAKWRGVYINGALLKGLEYVALGNPAFDKNLIMLKRQEYEAGIGGMLADAEPESDYHPVLQSSECAVGLPVPHLPDGLSIPLD